MWSLQKVPSEFISKEKFGVKPSDLRVCAFYVEPPQGSGAFKTSSLKGTLDFQDFTAFFSLVFYSSEGGS